MITNALPPETGLSGIAADYDVILCDVWGVLHNGTKAWPEAGEALAHFRSRGGTVVLVSNAPRPSEDIVPILDHLGVPRFAWDGIVSSGDMARAAIQASAGKPLHHIGPDKDHGLFHGVGIRRVGAEEAEVAVITGLMDDTTEHPEDYRPTLETLFARQVPMICANPDLVVERGREIVWCAGAIAQLYEEMGGQVTWLGKPHPPIYHAALDIAASLRQSQIERTRILAIGDAIRTDVAGANAIGVDSLFMTGGIHGKELGDPPQPEAFARLLENTDVPPVGWAKRLVWTL